MGFIRITNSYERMGFIRTMMPTVLTLEATHENLREKKGKMQGKKSMRGENERK